ncbi:hypothetical protein Bb109J_c2429 [Bdellovibrio bacteriovorus]|uniref:hypothetical protein n=1 Tax=Bdellovibrio bacteriovorus TaxID=959 RepID=UPI00045C026A|nr:hypothetical protein [Bdellovibrio bacteriovorus]AHZ85119.1 hypothetical protein EP01_09240 [Bdellovibrio bacteriovorus]BEV69009.1 hypothetical protein Bb109J_c2429 [Bdellovibrio bacteriovorus]
MIKKSLLPLILFSFAGSLAHAGFIGGDEKGNGGSVIYCENRFESQRYEVLDLFEAREIQTFEMDVIEGIEYKKILREMIARLADINPTRASLYYSFLETFDREALFLKGTEFTDIPDRGWGALPKGCTLVQGAVQYKRPSIKGHRYYFNKDVWDRMTNTQRSALVLHEFIYREGLQPENNFQTSNGVRLMNGFLHSTMMRDVTLPQYIDLLQRSGLQLADANGYHILLHSGQEAGRGQSYRVAFNDMGIITLATLARSFYLYGPGGRPMPVHCGTAQESAPERGGGVITFWPSGKVKHILMSCTSAGFVLRSKEAIGQATASELIYNEQGLLSQIKTLQLELNHVDYSLRSTRPGGYVTFYQSGEPSQVCIGNYYADHQRSWIRDSTGEGAIVAQSGHDTFGLALDGRIYESLKSRCGFPQ